MLKKITSTTLCGLFVAGAAFAQPQLLEQVAKVTAADAAALDLFGISVSVSGDTAIVGAVSNNVGAGSAYVFERDEGGPGNWGQVVKITAADAAISSGFGSSVSVSGDTVVVGASADDELGTNAGAAYVFERNEGGPGNWGQVAKITAADAATFAAFGNSVSLSVDTAIVGTLDDDEGGTDSGAAYVFERDEGGPGNWGQVAKITAADAAAFDQFGASVSLSVDTVIVGAYGNDDGGTDSGSAYVFERDEGGPGGWGQVAKITAADAAAGDWFGISVSVSGDTAMVGARQDDDAGGDSGSVYFFERDEGGPGNWGQVVKITADDAAAGDFFGHSVFLRGDTAIVGARNDNDAGNDSGSAYAFKRDEGGPGTWGQVAKITADDAAAGDFFGHSVSVSGDTVIVGAYLNDDAGSDSGSAYIFRFIGPLLTIPTEIAAVSGAPVDVLVELTNNSNTLASVAFSVDYDADCLSFDPTDDNADGIPDAIDISLPATFSAVVFFALGDIDGEIDVAFFANDPTTTTFTDGTLATVTFTATCSSTPTDSVIAPVVFSSDPAPSFGDPDAQIVVGGSVDGSVEIFSGIRGDCNGDGIVVAPDITALLLESFDGDGTFWADTLDVVPFLGSPVGCDANADTLVDAGDISCIVRLIFGLTCGGGALRAPSGGPSLSLPGELRSAGGSVVLPITFEPRGNAINSLIFSLDYDESRLIFDDVPGAVRFLGTPVSLQRLTFDASDTDGELDVVIADLTTTQELREGLLLEVDLRLLEPGAVTIEDAVTFSAEPPASFGGVLGISVPGTAEVVVATSIFADGFETGDTLAWSEAVP